MKANGSSIFRVWSQNSEIGTIRGFYRCVFVFLLYMYIYIYIYIFFFKIERKFKTVIILSFGDF